MSDKVLARVEDKEITNEVVDKFLTELGPQVSMQFNNPMGRKRIVDELVSQELFYLNALEEGIDKEEGFLTELEKLKEGLLKQYVIGKLLEDVKVEDADLKEYYNENTEMFKKPETVMASHILVDSEEKANDIAKEIKDGLAFEEAAKEYSSCPSNQQGGNLGEFGRGQMVPEFEEAAFSLEIDELSSPVKTDHGYHLIVVKEKNEEGIMPFEEVKENLRMQLLGLKQQEKYLAKSDELKEKYDVEVNI